MDTHISCFQEKSSLSDIAALDKEIVKYIRNQRHDFMNDIQIIWGYLQLDKSEEAKKYITGLIKELEVHRRILNLSSPVLALFLYDYIVKAGRIGIDVDFEIETEQDVLGSDYHIKLVLMDKLFEEVMCRIVENKLDKKVYLDVFDEDGNVYIVFSNNGHDVLDEDDEVLCCPDIKRETREVIDNAGKAGIYSNCLIDGNMITAKIWFEF